KSRMGGVGGDGHAKSAGTASRQSHACADHASTSKSSSAMGSWERLTVNLNELPVLTSGVQFDQLKCPSSHSAQYVLKTPPPGSSRSSKANWSGESVAAGSGAERTTSTSMSSEPPI